MSSPHLVVLQGFSAFERSALGSYFRLATNRSPAYEQVESLVESQFVVADADHHAAVQAVLAAGRVGQTVFIGSQAPAGATAWMMRPIDPLHVLRELDAMVALQLSERAPLVGLSRQRSASDGAGAHPSAWAAASPRPEPAGPLPARRSTDGRIRSSGFIGLADIAQPPARRAAPLQPVQPARPPARRQQALLVDDSEIAQRFLETRLQPHGLHTQRAMTSGKAIELLSQQAFEFVFLDVELGAGSDLDGLALCQHIKRQHRQVGGVAPPVVVLVSAHHSELDRVRGMLAGCDAYLAKPLADAVLQQLLVQHGVAPAAGASAVPAG